MTETAGDTNSARAHDTRARRPIRRWLIRACAFAVATLVITHYREILDLTKSWLEGNLKNDRIAWGLSIRTRGRIGKSLQYVAGATVILDLIGPERLGALSDKWKQRRQDLHKRAERHVEIFPVATLRGEMKESIVFEKEYYSVGGHGEGITSVTKMKVSRGGAPRAAGLSQVVRQADLDAWHAATVATLPTAHTCTGRHGRPGETACHEQVEFASSAVDDFLRAHLPAQDLADAAEDSKSGGLALRRRSLRTLGVILALPMIYVMVRYLIPDLAAHRVKTTAPGDLLAWAFLGLFFAVGVLANAEETPSRSSLGRGFFRVILWIRMAPLSGVMRALAKILVKARPTNALKWFAVGLALVGFGLDMLAS
ncbi:hypothetical protein [Lentzea terrae]|uniref:hypothetical protein n=1 Tax=Lentzea terrae TaxID=2200761 RepID=UPI001300AA56|nr:hypothetical protein [Lentzea terrae]